MNNKTRRTLIDALSRLLDIAAELLDEKPANIQDLFELNDHDVLVLLAVTATFVLRKEGSDDEEL